MGERGNIRLVYTNNQKIYLYTHWNGYKMMETLKRTLKRSKSRWSDESYLARIIFTDFTKDAGDGLTGFGLAPYEMDKNHETITVDLRRQVIETKTMKPIKFEDYINED